MTPPKPAAPDPAASETATAPVALGFFKALAHESRLKLLGLLAAREHSVQELARETGLSEPTISHHASILRAQDLVSLRADGTTHWYAFKAQALRTMARSLLSRETVAGFAPDEAINAADAKIMKGFLLPDGRLKTFPASRKKRRVFACWFARMLETGRDYREAEINAVIQRHHNDCETFRREMVGYNMLTRNRAGVYRRLPESEWVEN